MNILGKELEIVNHFKYFWTSRGMWCGNGDHKTGGTRMETFEVRPYCTTERCQRNRRGGLQNSDPASNAGKKWATTKKKDNRIALNDIGML